MTCDGCAKDITGALHKLPGITKVEANVADQLVSVEGTGSFVRLMVPPFFEFIGWCVCDTNP
jgi:copper chaperone CopZ